MNDTAFYGTDIAINSLFELVFNGIDFGLVKGIDCILQNIILRLLMPKGSYFYDPDFGSDLYMFVKAPYTALKLDHFKSVVKESLKAEPLINNDSIEITLSPDKIDGFYCEVSFKILGYDNELNLVVSAEKELKIWRKAA